MLAKNVNDNACFLDKRGAGEFFASKLAPTTARSKCGSWLACDSGLTTNQDVRPSVYPLAFTPLTQGLLKALQERHRLASVPVARLPVPATYRFA